MEAANMSRRGRKAWNMCYDIMLGHELTPESLMMKIEVINLMKKSMPDASDVEIGLMLIILADSNMSDLVEKNG